MTIDQDGWSQWSQHVLAELKKNYQTQEVFRKDIESLRVEIAVLKVKSGIWGLIGASIPTVGAILFMLLKG